MKEINIAMLSDLHGDLRANAPEDADILIVAGDSIPYGIQDDKMESAFWYASTFQEWLERQPVDHIYFIAGNHDALFDKTDIGSPMHPTIDPGFTLEFGSKATYIYCDHVVHDGLKIYGSPWTPWFWNWAFNLPDGNPEMTQAHWELIPDDTDILITHGPCHGILDVARNTNCGCPDLLNRVGQLNNLKLHVFGHIHEGFGHRQIDDVHFVNAAYGDYKRYRRPLTAPTIKIEI